MTKQIMNGISYILLLIAAFLLSVFYRQPFFVLLVLLLFFIPFFSYYVSRHTLSKLKFALYAPVLASEKGTVIPLHVQIENSSIFPIMHCEMILSISSPFYPKEDTETLILPIFFRNTTELSFPVSYAKSGCYEAALLRVKIYDYLHVFSFEKALSEQLSIKVFPFLTGDVPYHAQLYSEGFDEYEENVLKGNISSNVTDVREYRPGDRLQKIHWKLSAKIDSLMVKENEATSSHRFCVLLELYQRDSTSNTLDITLDNAYMIGTELLSQREQFLFSVYSITKEDFVTLFIQTKEDLLSAFEQIYYETPYTEENLAYTVIQKSGQLQGNIIHVTHEGLDDDSI